MKKLLMLAVLLAIIACGESIDETTISDSVNVTTDIDTMNASGITADTTSRDNSKRSDTTRRDSL